METLRSLTQLTGPALGLLALTFRAWFYAKFGAQFGDKAWAQPDKIPRIHQDINVQQVPPPRNSTQRHAVARSRFFAPR